MEICVNDIVRCIVILSMYKFFVYVYLFFEFIVFYRVRIVVVFFVFRVLYWLIFVICYYFFFVWVWNVYCCLINK